MSIATEVHKPSRRPVVRTDPKKGAKQSFKDECDINNIMAKYRKTGLVSHVQRNQGRFVDVSEVGSSYQEAIHRVRSANEFFMGLPAEVRQRFKNDASAFLDWIADPANRKEVEEYGLEPLVEAKDEPERDRKSVV